MKKAVVVGGSNGIGLAISLNLLKNNYHVIIVDRSEPQEEYYSGKDIEYIKCDLLDFNIDIFSELSKDNDIEFLMITAGFGRVTNFENISCSEIENMIAVNTLAGIKIIRFFNHFISYIFIIFFFNQNIKFSVICYNIVSGG